MCSVKKTRFLLKFQAETLKPLYSTHFPKKKCKFPEAAFVLEKSVGLSDICTESYDIGDFGDRHCSSMALFLLYATFHLSLGRVCTL